MAVLPQRAVGWRSIMFEQRALPQRWITQLRLVTSRMKRWQAMLGLLCFVAINGYIVYALYRDREQIRSLSQLQVDAPLLAIPAALQFVGLLIPIAGWAAVMRHFGDKLSFRQHFKVYAVSNLARKLPGVAWNILSRVYMYEQRGGDRVQVSVASVAEFLIFGVAAAFVALITMLISGDYPAGVPPALLVGVLLAFVGFVCSPLFGRVVGKISKAEHTPHLRWHHMLSWAALNVVTIVLGGVSLYIFCQAFGLIDRSALLPLIQAWALTVVTGSLLFWMPSMFDVTAGILVLSLTTVMPTPQALLLLIAWRVWCWINEVAWGVLGFSL
jgi:hypothetical protein